MLQHTYLSWARSGFGRYASNDTRELNLNVTLPNAGTGQIKIPPMKLYGPGDCIGFDPSIIVRTDPPLNVSNFEANFFPFIEFRRPDFPWLLTPQQPDNNNNRRLPPWLCLIVVNVNEAKPEISSNPSAQTILRVAPKYLPDLADAWAWAHCQISYDGDGADADLIKNKLQNDPAARLSRLLCPRQLEDNQRYYACVVPTYEAGRRAGLTGLPDVDPSKPNPLQLAWDIASASASITLPVYFYWEFATGSAGDFESLVRSLQPYTVEPEKKIGQRTILVQTAAATAPSEIVLEGILRAPRQSISNPSLSNDEIGSNLKSNGIPLPIYGSVYNKGKSWDDLGEGDGWLNTLNRNPGYRIAAGLGAQIVRKNQETYMATAWDRLGDARGANQQIAQAQLSNLANARSFERLSNIPIDSLHRILFQAELQRTKQSPFEVASAFGTPISALYASTFRRFVGANSPIVRRMNAKLPNESRATPATLDFGKFKGIAGQNIKIFDMGNNEWKPLLDSIARSERKDFLSIDRLLSDDLKGIASNNLRNSLENLELQASPVTVRTMDASTQTIDDDEQRQYLRTKYDPQTTLLDVVRGKINIVDDTSSNFSSVTTIKDVQPFTAPESTVAFPDALFEELKTLSHDYILPGVEHLPNNSVTILEANAEFIAAFMVGVNHEFHRELKWRNFPIDQAHTYFRSFWVKDRKDITIPSIGGPLNAMYQNKAGAILALRGTVLQNYQETLLYLIKAGGSIEKPVFSTTSNQDSQIELPIFQVQIASDICLLGFERTVHQLQGMDPTNCEQNDTGYFVVLQQPAIELHFGLDIPTTNVAATNECDTQNSVSWNDVPLMDNKYIKIDAWQGVNRSADLASRTRQLPVQLAIHARELLPACAA